MVVTFHGQASGALSGCCAEPRLRPCRRWRTTPQLRLFPRPARPPSPRHPRGCGRRSVVRAARTPPLARAAGLCGSAVPLGGVECAMCVPLGGVEWCARDTARLRSHQRGRRHRRVARRPRAAGLPVKSNPWRCRAVPAVQGPYCTRAAHLVQELSFYVGITTTIRKVLVHHGRCVMERGGTKASWQG